MHLPDQLPPQKRVPLTMLDLYNVFVCVCVHDDEEVSFVEPEGIDGCSNNPNAAAAADAAAKYSPLVVANHAADGAAADAEPLGRGGGLAEERVGLPAIGGGESGWVCCEVGGVGRGVVRKRTRESGPSAKTPPPPKQTPHTHFHGMRCSARQ